VKPRILFVSHSCGLYGAGRCLLSLLDVLDRDRCEMLVVCPERGALADEIERRGLPVRLLPCTPWIMENPVWSESLVKLPAQAANVGRFIPFLKKQRIDLVHCNSVACLEAAAAAKTLRVPVVVHCREMLKNSPYGFSAGWRAACRMVDRLADKVVCMSRAVRAQMLEAGCRPSRSVVVYDFFPRPQAPPAPPARKDSAPIIGCVAGLHPRKGHEVLLRAFAAVRRAVPDARLRIIGGGKAAYVEKLKKNAVDLGVERAVEFLGEVREPGRFFGNFRVFALPSRAEAFGLVYGEAAQYGVPAIGTSDGGASEIIEDGVTGFIVAPEDAQALAAALVKLLENPRLAREMGRRARERVARLFTPEKLARGVENVYDELLKCKGGPVRR